MDSESCLHTWITFLVPIIVFVVYWMNYIHSPSDIPECIAQNKGNLFTFVFDLENDNWIPLLDQLQNSNDISNVRYLTPSQYSHFIQLCATTKALEQLTRVEGYITHVEATTLSLATIK